MLPDAASLAVPIVLREKGISGPLPCPATPAPSCRLAHQWLEGCWTPRLKVDLGACVAPSHPPPCPRLCSLSTSEPTSRPTRRTATAPSNAPRRQLTWGARARPRLFSDLPLALPSLLTFVVRLEASGARVRYFVPQLRVLGSRPVQPCSLPHETLAPAAEPANQKRLGQILGPKPEPGKQAHSKGPLLFPRLPPRPFPFPIHVPRQPWKFILYTV